ncbi:MAG: sodium-dependent transporter [Chlamydiota bacterium]
MKLPREHWASRFGFVMAAAGSAIGLGSLWRFPYIAGQNGGGAFVLLYILFTLVLAAPVFIAELLIGRKTQSSPVFAYQLLAKKASNWKMIGYLNILTCFLILSFYCVISGWCLNYTFMSLNQFSIGKTDAQISQIFNIVASSPNLSLFWLALFLLLNIGIVYSGIRKGIEHWSRILTPALLVILIALTGYSCTLKGFPQAFAFIFTPRWSACTPDTILKALGMAFFSLSAGLGIIVTYGSYLKSEENLVKTTGIVAIMTLFVSITAALMMFPIAFSHNFSPDQGPGLIFKIMPVLFAKLPGSLIISTVFFLLFVFTALTSSISLLEVIVANLMELLKWNRAKAVITASVATFLFGIPSALGGSKKLFPTWEQIYGKDFLTTMDDITADWMLPLAGLLTTVFIGYRVNHQISREEFCTGTTWHSLFRPWLMTIRYIVPAIIVIILLTKAGILNLNAIAN